MRADSERSFTSLLANVFDVEFSTLLLLRIFRALNDTGIESIDLSDFRIVQSQKEIARYVYSFCLVAWASLLAAVVLLSFIASAVLGFAILILGLPAFAFGCIYVRIAIEAGLLLAAQQTDR